MINKQVTFDEFGSHWVPVLLASVNDYFLF